MRKQPQEINKPVWILTRNGEPIKSNGKILSFRTKVIAEKWLKKLSKFSDDDIKLERDNRWKLNG